MTRVIVYFSYLFFLFFILNHNKHAFASRDWDLFTNVTAPTIPSISESKKKVI